uniref:C-X-C motif chemokine 16 n=1 Tax=Cavia porcellus TaxID=10141 RepID=A0A286XY48_CAVPO
PRLSASGDGNEGSIAGSCHCDKTVSSDLVTAQLVTHVRKYVKGYQLCAPLTYRFQLYSQSVCGGSRDQWVLEVVSCLDRGECGHAYRKNPVHQKIFASPGTPIPRPTEGHSPESSTPAQKYPPSALQSITKPTLLPGTHSLDTRLTHLSETSTPMVGYGLEAGHRAMENQQGAIGSASAVVSVVLGATVVIAIGVFFCIRRQRRTRQLQQYTPGVIA